MCYEGNCLKNIRYFLMLPWLISISTYPLHLTKVLRHTIYNLKKREALFMLVRQIEFSSLSLNQLLGEESGLFTYSPKLLSIQEPLLMADRMKLVNKFTPGRDPPLSREKEQSERDAGTQSATCTKAEVISPTL